MEINPQDYYLFTDYSDYAMRIDSFPDYLNENNLEISKDEYNDYLTNYILKSEILTLFSKYVQKIHKELEWKTNVIEESKKDMYFHLLHIANVGLKIDYKNLNRELTTVELFTILLTNRFQFLQEGINDVEISNELNRVIKNYGYIAFLDFKKYLLENSNQKPTIKKQIKLSNPDKIAVLIELGIEETLKKFPITEDKYRFIHELIGGNYDNIKKVMIAGVSNENKRNAKDFINSKTI